MDEQDAKPADEPPFYVRPMERRSQPPVSLDVIAFQVGAMQSALDRGMAQLERTMERGFSELKIEVASLSVRVGELEQGFVKMDGRVEAVEQFRKEEEDRIRRRQEQVEDRAEVASVDQAQLRMWKWLAAGAVGFVGVGGFVLAIVSFLSA